jgi:hypothetical protein
MHVGCQAPAQMARPLIEDTSADERPDHALSNGLEMKPVASSSASSRGYAPLELSVLHRPEDLALGGGAHVRDLVDEQGPAAGQLELALDPALGSREGPRSWPKSRLSSSVSLSAAALKATKAREVRKEELWMARASSVLRVPDSPRIRTGNSVTAATRARSRQEPGSSASRPRSAPRTAAAGRRPVSGFFQ